MVGKKSSKVILREEGLARTDNNMHLSTWPQVGMINQKNYYTEYLKRDDQYLALRTLQEENMAKMRRDAQDRDRVMSGIDDSTAMDVDDGDGSAAADAHGSKIIVIHPGSQNLRVGLANDALPKTVPMVIARQHAHNESEESDAEPRPKRLKTEHGEWQEPEKCFGLDFGVQFTEMATTLKQHMRANKRKLLPNSKELVVNYNRRTVPEEIKEHNDPHRIDWTEIPARNSPAYICGQEALRIPEQSKPRYKLFWPLRDGTLNEVDYDNKNVLWQDYFTIIIEALRSELGIKDAKELRQYSCVFLVPDLYERVCVTTILDMLLHEFEFKRVSFMQEGLAATFGAGWSAACIVDIGAQKTSICCVDEGLVQEDSRMNIKFGGADVTELFVKMMLYDHFPYQEINLKRRYDWLLAQELKQKVCTLNEAEIAVQLHEFHLRAAEQDTRKYTFKTYDEVLLAPMGFFRPSIFDNTSKLLRRRRLVDRSYDLYDNSPNDPTSESQQIVLTWARENITQPASDESLPDGRRQPALQQNNGKTHPTDMPRAASNLLLRLNDNQDATPRSSAANSPAPEGTPQPGAAEKGAETNESLNPSADAAEQRIMQAEQNDRIVPVMPLDLAILESIRQGHRGDERKARDFYGGILLVGGGAKFPYFASLLEERLKLLLPREILIGEVPRELDPQLVVWKGGSVFGRLSSSGNDSWIYQKEYAILGSKLLAQKCMWNW